MDSQGAISGDDYRKYLQRGGVSEILKNVLLDMYEALDASKNPNEYLCTKFAELSGSPLIEKLKADILLKKEQVKTLEGKVTYLEDELKKYNNASDEQPHTSTTNL